MLDVLISNGLIIDGTGAPGYRADIGVESNTLVVLRNGTKSVQARRTIDASDQVVSPGFIDMHAHSGLMILEHPAHDPKVRQGVTTEVIGVDGNSYAPFRRQRDLRDFLRLNAGLDGSPRLDQRWSTVDQYLKVFDRKVAVNIAYVIGNSALRINSVGWENRAATPAQLADMIAMLREGMEEGAFGLSTGLDYPPGSYADTAEIVALAEQVATMNGIYHTHVRYGLGDRFLDPFREAIEIGSKGGVPVHITHLYQRMPTPGPASRMLSLVETAKSGGVDVTFDSYPYPLSSSRLLIVIPAWAHDGGPGQLMKILALPKMRNRLRAEVRPRGPSWQDMFLTNFRRRRNHRFEGRSVAEIAALLRKHEADAICDLLLDERLELCYVSANGNAITLPKFLSHPLAMISSDGILLGSFPSPRTYGTFAIVLSEFVRSEGFLSLPEAIRKMTSYPAMRLGLADRGVIRDRMRADLVIFDPAKVDAPATRQQPRQFPTAIDYVLINGELVIDRGNHTGKLPGRALRRGRTPSS